MITNFSNTHPALSLSRAQSMLSEASQSSSRLSRGMSSYNEHDDESVGPITCNNFEKLIRSTPFKNSRSRISLTSTPNISRSHQELGQNSQSASDSNDQNTKQGAEEGSTTSNRDSPLRRALTPKKKSHFSKYERKPTTTGELDG